MRKIRILEAIRQGKIGGGESHVLDLCRHINKELFEVVVLSFTPGPMVDELNRIGIRTIVLNTETPFNAALWKMTEHIIIEEKIDIVHAHGTRACSNVFFAAKKCNKPLIYTVHGWSFHMDQSWYMFQARRFSELFLTRMSNHVICVSKSNQDEGIRLLRMKRSSVIFNAINLDKFNYEGNYPNIREEFGIPSDAPVVGYIVRITGQKDPFTMIKAMAEVVKVIPTAILLVVGEGDLKDKTIQLARDLNVDKNIVFKPFRTDIPAVLNAINIYCLPSLWEGFPIGILEAMAMKKGVVCSPADGNRELVNHNETGVLVEIGDYFSLAKSIIDLFHDEQKINYIANNAFELVKNHFTSEKQIKQIEDLYVAYDIQK